MPRRAFTPTTDEQRAVLARLDEVAARVRQDTAELWETIEAARACDVAKEEVARRTKGAVSRATVYRRLSRAGDE